MSQTPRSIYEKKGAYRKLYCTICCSFACTEFWQRFASELNDVHFRQYPPKERLFLVGKHRSNVRQKVKLIQIHPVGLHPVPKTPS
jgi:hypothetical protein